MSEFWTGPESILRGYLARQELNQKQQELNQQQEYAKGLLDYHHKALDAATKNAKAEMDLRNALFKQTSSHYYNQLYGSPLDAPASAITGINPQTQISQQPNEIQGQLGNIGLTPDVQHSMQFQAQPWQYQPDEFKGTDLGSIIIDPNYQEKLARLGLTQAQMAAAQKGLEAAAVYPYQKGLLSQKDEDALQRAMEGFQNKLDLMDKSNQMRLDVADKNNFGREMAALIRAQYALQNQVNPESILQHYDAMRRGIEDEKDVPIKEKGLVMSLFNNRGERPLSTKDAGDLRGLSNLDRMFDRLEDAGKYLSDTPGGRLGTWVKSMLPTDFNNALAQFKQDAPEGVRGLTGVNTGRLLQFELDNFIKANIGGAKSKTMFLKNLASLKQDYYDKILSDKLGGMPMSQQSDIINSNREFHNHFWVPIHNNSNNKDEEILIEDYNDAIRSGQFSPYIKKK